MIDKYAAFSQSFLKVTIGNWIAHVKEDRVQDDAFGKMCSFEIGRHPLLPNSTPTWFHVITHQR